MTPKEKAIELINSFENYVVQQGFVADLKFKNCKYCAIVCVDEIIKIWSNADGLPGSTYQNPGKYFWMMIRLEILKMEPIEDF